MTTNTATGAITFQTQDSFGNAKNVGSDTTIRATSDAGTGTFSASAGGTYTTTLDVTISSGSNSSTVFYKDSATGTPTITVDENPSQGWTSATQQQTISAVSVAITYSLSRSVKDADTLTITATFSGAIDGTPTIAIDTQSTDLAATNMTGTVPSATWTHAYDVPSGSDGTATITLANAKIGSDNAAVPTNRTFTIDNTVPTVALTYNPNRAVRNADTLTVTATFDAAISGTPQIAINTTSTDLAATNMTDGGTQKVWTYSYDVPSGSDGSATVTITGATDTALNANATATNNTITIDNTGPTVTLTYSPTGQKNAGDTVSITGTFDAAVSGTAKISIDTVGTDLASTSMTDSGDQKVWTYSYTVPSDSDGTATVTVSDVTDTALNAVGTITNKTFTIGSTGGQTVADPLADLGLTTSTASGQAVVGDNLTYTYTVTNYGPDNAFGVKLVDVLPVGVSFVSSSTTAGACSGTGTVTCVLDGIGPLKTVTVTIKVKFDAAGTVANSATVSGSRKDPGPQGNTVTVTTEVVSPLTVTFTYEPDRDVKPGDVVVITATFNRPPGYTPTISIDTTGEDSGLVSMTSTGDGSVWTYSYVVPEGSDGEATVTINELKDDSGDDDKNTNNTFTIDSTGPSVALTYEPDENVAAGDTVVITATFDEAVKGTPTISVDTSGIDLSSAVMTASGDGKVWSYSYTVPADSDGQATVTIAGGEDEAGNPNKPASNNSFKIGPKEIGVSLSYEPEDNILPGSTVVITATFDGSFTGTPNINLDTLGPDLGPLVMTKSEDGLVWTFTYEVPEGSEGEVKVSISGLTGGSNNQTVKLTNDTFVVTEDTTDLSVGVKASADSAVRRGELTYTVTLLNQGPATATGVTSVNELPAGVIFESFSPQSLDCREDSGSVECDLSTLLAEESVVVSIKVVVNDEADGTLVFRSNVSGSQTDPDSSNNDATVETQVIVGVLSYVVSIKDGDIDATGIVLTDSPDPVFLGNDLSYDLDVSNSGSNAVTEVNLIVTLPSSVGYASAVVDFENGGGSANLGLTDPPSPAAKVASLLSGIPTRVGECSEGSGTIICALGDLVPGQTVRVTIVVEPTAVGILNNQAKLVQEGAASDASSTSADESTTVMLMSDLSISLPAISSNVLQGDQINLEFSITNAGPSSATGIVLTGNLPDGVRLISPTGCTISNGEIQCQVGSLASGESRTIILVLGLDPSIKGDLSNTFTVTGDQADTDSTSNTITAKISITEVADLKLERTDLTGPADGPPPVKDDEIASEFTVTNNGPSGATNVVLTHELSVDVTLVSVSGDPAACSVDGGEVSCRLDDLPPGESAIFAMILAPETGGNFTGLGTVRSDQSGIGGLDLEPVEFFLDLSETEQEVEPSSSLLDLDSGRNANFWIAAALVGFGVGAIALFLGRNFIFGGKKRSGSTSNLD